MYIYIYIYMYLHIDIIYERKTIIEPRPGYIILYKHI